MDFRLASRIIGGIFIECLLLSTRAMAMPRIVRPNALNIPPLVAVGAVGGAVLGASPFVVTFVLSAATLGVGGLFLERSYEPPQTAEGKTAGLGAKTAKYFQWSMGGTLVAAGLGGMAASTLVGILGSCLGLQLGYHISAVGMVALFATFKFLQRQRPGGVPTTIYVSD